MPADSPHFPFNCCRMPTSLSILNNKPFPLSNWLVPGYCLGTTPSILLCHSAQPWVVWCWFQGGTGTGQAGLLWLKELQENSKSKELNQVIPHSGTAASQVRRGAYWEWASFVDHFCLSKKCSTGVKGLTASLSWSRGPGRGVPGVWRPNLKTTGLFYTG